MTVESPTLYNGEKHSDERGSLYSFNEVDLRIIRRFYIIQQNADTVRAWQGHKIEQKWFHVLSGSFKVILVQPDNWETPSMNLSREEILLTSKCSQILHITGGYATGFKALEDNSKLMVFSNFTLEESIADSYRFDRTIWYKW